MNKFCSTCRFYSTAEGQSECQCVIPANLAAFLKIESPYDVPGAYTHPEWSCGLWSSDDEFYGS